MEKAAAPYDWRVMGDHAAAGAMSLL